MFDLSCKCLGVCLGDIQILQVRSQILSVWNLCLSTTSSLATSFTCSCPVAKFFKTLSNIPFTGSQPNQLTECLLCFLDSGYKLSNSATDYIYFSSHTSPFPPIRAKLPLLLCLPFLLGVNNSICLSKTQNQCFKHCFSYLCPPSSMSQSPHALHKGCKVKYGIDFEWLVKDLGWLFSNGRDGDSLWMKWLAKRKARIE